MQDIKLLRVPARETIERALASMREQDVRGIVVDHGKGRLRLHMNRELLQAAADGVKTCGELTGGRTVAALDAPSPTELDRLVVSYSMRDMAPGGGMLEAFSPSSSAPRMATLTTRHEGLAAQILSAVKVCRCDTHPHHIVDCPPDYQGASCPSGDGGTMQCY